METALISSISNSLGSFFDFGTSMVTSVGTVQNTNAQQQIAETQQTTAFLSSIASINNSNAEGKKQTGTIVLYSAIAVVVVAIVVLLIVKKRK